MDCIECGGKLQRSDRYVPLLAIFNGDKVELPLTTREVFCLDCGLVHNFNDLDELKEILFDYLVMPYNKKSLEIDRLDVACTFCHSHHVTSEGVQQRKHSIAQMYKCQECGTVFTLNRLIKPSWDTRLKSRKFEQFKEEVVKLATEEGLSPREMANFIKENIGLDISYVQIYKWRKKYGKKDVENTDCRY